MKDTHLTRQERWLISWLRILAGTFATFTFIFIFLPDRFLIYLSEVGRILFGFGREAALLSPQTVSSEGSFHFWWVWGVGLWITLTWASFRAIRDWPCNFFLVPILLPALGSTALGFSVLFFWKGSVTQAFQFSYLVALIASGTLFLITMIAYAQAKRTKKF